jgi:polar amino acid transport system substrate-binding protein
VLWRRLLSLLSGTGSGGEVGKVAARLRAVITVLLLLLTITGMPGLVASASVQPRPVTVATHDMAPFVDSAKAIKSGFSVDILDQIAKRQGWDLTYLDVGGVGDQLKAVADGRADAAAGAVSITAERSQIFDFSQPTLNAGLQIAVPAGATERNSPGLVDFLKLLFSKSILVWLGAALVLTVIPAHIIWLVERGHADSMVSKSYFPGIFQAFGWGLGMLAAAPDDAPRHWIARAMAVVWAFVSIIFVAYYTATLTANLTVEQFDSQIHSPSDLVGKKVCTVAKTTSASFLRTLGVTPTEVPSIDVCFNGIRDRSFDAVVYDAPVLRYHVANDGAGVMALAGPVFQNEDYGIAFRNGSDLRKEADEALLSMREDGTYELIKQKWFGSDEGG